MSPEIMIVALAVAGLAVTMLLALALPLYAKHTGERYSLLNHFPYELLESLNPWQRRYLQIPLMLLGAAIPAFFYGAFAAPGLYIPYIIVGIAVLAAAAFVLLFYVRTRVVERHVLAASLFMMLVLLLDMFVAYYAFTTPFDAAFGDMLRYGSLALGLAELLVMLNPKLKRWSQLEATDNQGAVAFRRPRYFILPLSEWVSFANMLILAVITLLSLWL